MKGILIIIAIQCSMISFSEAKETKLKQFDYKIDTLPTSELSVFLRQINVASYYGKPVDSFLLAMPANIYNQKIYGDTYSKGGDCRAYKMVADFVRTRGTGPGVTIYVKEFAYINSSSPNCTWDLTLFRKEKIYKIEVWKDQNTCINGSCMQ